MSDVSTRAFSFFLAFEREGHLDIDALIAGLPVTRAQLENRRGRIAWDTWAQLCERFGSQMPSAEQVEAAGGAVIEPMYLGPLLGLVGILTDPADLYRVGIRWFAPHMYQNLAFSIRELPARALEIGVDVPEGARGSLAFMQMTVGGLRAIPRLLGLPEASVVAELTPMRGRFLVTLPPPRDARSWLRRVAASLRGASAVVGELSEQQGRIAESYAALARAERGFRSVLEALPVAVAVHRAGKLVYASSALARLTGLDADALMGTSVVELAHPEDRDVLTERLARVTTEPFELRLANRAGPVHVECGLLGGFIFDGEPSQLLFAIDLTARRLALQALTRSEEINSVFIKVLPDLALRVERGGTLLEVRAGAGHPETALVSALVGTSIHAFSEVLPDVTQRLIHDGMAKVQEAIDTRREVSFAVDSALLDTERRYEARIFPASGEEAVVLVRDVTDERRNQERVAIAERMATLGTVAAGVAHELNNPLTYVIANVSLAVEEIDRVGTSGAADLTKIRQDLSEALLGAERAMRIAADLGVFSRGTTDERRPVNVRTVLDSVIAMTQGEVRARAQLELSVDEAIEVDVDPSRLGQVFVNLVVNAMQAIPEGEPGHHVWVRASVNAEGWQEIVVQDDGIGMDAAARARLFHPFATTKAHGTGLGLTICHRLISEIGGRIEVDSAPGVGSTFRVLLPPSTGERARAPSASETTGRRGRILFVDDDELVARAVLRTLQAHDVSWVPSGEEALVRLETERFDMVLCDLTLGGIDGLEVREQVSRRDPALAARFLFLSGGALTARARDLLAKEPDRCLSKPFPPRDLRARIAEELARHA